LAVSGGQLFIAWAGQTNNNQLFVSTVTPGSNAVPPPVGLPETSGQSPALADLNGKLVIAWSGSGNHVLLAMELNTDLSLPPNQGGITPNEASKVANASDI